MLLPEFSRERVDVGEANLRVAIGGEGPPLLLLHGYPETHLAWHAVAPQLARRFTVVCPDLPGYGQSRRRQAPDSPERYSKRAMARDMAALMRTLGHERFALAGHDRGGVVSYRLALDHPDAVAHLAVMSVLPTPEQWAAIRGQQGMMAYHLFLLAQPFDFPERLLGAAPEIMLQHTLDTWSGSPGAIVAEARADYGQAFRDPHVIHAMCEDYRANATIDVEHDEADREAGRRITAPTLILWEQPPGVELPFDPLEVWKRWADSVRGQPLACGHFLPEERPNEVARILLEFFAESSGQPARLLPEPSSASMSARWFSRCSARSSLT